MDNMVATIVTSATGEMQTLVTAVISNYWGIIFSLFFVVMIIGLVWMVARKMMGR
jgi:hypothetical protein